MDAGELTLKAKETFGKNVFVLPPGAISYTAKVGAITEENGEPQITIWPYPYKDQTFSLKDVKITPDGWIVQGANGPVRLRPLREGETGPQDA